MGLSHHEPPATRGDGVLTEEGTGVLTRGDNMRDRGLVGRRGVTAALAISLAAGFLAVGTAVVPAIAQPSVTTCTFDGKPGPVSITGVVPGTTTVSISCSGASGLSLASRPGESARRVRHPTGDSDRGSRHRDSHPAQGVPSRHLHGNVRRAGHLRRQRSERGVSSVTRSVQRGPRGLRHRGDQYLDPLTVTRSRGGLGVLDPDHPAKRSDAGDEFERGDRR